MSTTPPTTRDPATVSLPALEATTIRHPIGHIHHVIRPGASVEIVEIQECQVSARRAEDLLHLASGEKILRTRRKGCPFPEGTDGVLLEATDGSLHWLHHRLKDQFTALVTEGDWAEVRGAHVASWTDAIRYRTESLDAAGLTKVPGLRPAQVGALHAIGAHWSLSRQPGTVVMPTGTGKTEAMLAAKIAFVRGTLLVIVPSQPLRDQTTRKFLEWGLLRTLGIISDDAANPIVGVVTRRPRTESDLDIFDQCDVVIATMSALGQGTAEQFTAAIASKIDTLVVDEAHHIAAASWRAFRDGLGDCRVLQFTATPYRRDGQIVDGKLVYEYPLHQAQADGYFKPINFEPVFEVDPEDGDIAIAKAAVAKLTSDMSAGNNHVVMARCDNIARAERIHSIYVDIAPQFNPVLVHSHDGSASASVDSLRTGASRIVVCVDMLGEGFDLPQLKIAAVHDTHKSLAVLLQFTGRFTRSSADIGDATVIANIADAQVSSALERLYSEDADWNQLLSEFSSTAVQEHAQLIDFLLASTRLDGDAPTNDGVVSRSLLRPKFSAVAYRCEQFRPKRFHSALPKWVAVHGVWLHEGTQTLYFVTCAEPAVSWSRSKEVRDRQWDLFVLHYDPTAKILYVNSSDTSSLHEELARAVGGDNVQLIQGDTVFRTLGNIRRLVFQNIGVRKVGRRNLRYAMYTGADVKQALSQAERAGSVKSNLSGSGFEDGQPITIGCSYKGRVWSKENGPIRRFIDWCSIVGSKLNDSTIDTGQIIENVLIPDEVEQLPDAMVLTIDWPIELLRQSEERVILTDAAGEERSLSLYDIECREFVEGGTSIPFSVAREDAVTQLTLTIGGTRGFKVERVGGPALRIRIGRIEAALEEYLSDYPPLVRFVDMSELDGNLLVRPQTALALTLPPERLEPWDWSGVDITKESMWKVGAQRATSIQGHASQHYINGGFTIVFDDDAAGEAADLVCAREEDDVIRLALVHCKFSGGTAPGERVKDVVEVCSQAVRSAKWIWRFKELCRHITQRERHLRTPTRTTRFLHGTARDLNRILQASRFKPLRAEVIVVQPGLSQSSLTGEQSAVLAAACSFLKETVDVDLDIVCSE